MKESIRTIKIFVLPILFLVILTSTVKAAEPIPYKDFVEITNGVFDALDKVEAVFGNSESMKIEAKSALTNLSASLKKYERYVTDWPKVEESMQSEIWAGIKMAELYYRMMLTPVQSDDLYTKAKSYASSARKLFIKYKSKNKNKK